MRLLQYIKDSFIELLQGFIGAIMANLVLLLPPEHYRSYFKSVWRHKYYVFLAGLKIGVPLWQLIVHDWTKFLPDEFIPYANFFFNKELEDWEGKEAVRLYTDPKLAPNGFFIWERFDIAWLLHQRRSPHHWQFWYLVQDRDPWRALPMPMKYTKEMVADWCGAGRTYTGKWSVKEWYNANKDKILLHPDTRFEVERMIESFKME